MNIISIGKSCPAELVIAIQSATKLDDAFDTVRPLSFHSECFVSVAKARCNGKQVVVKSWFKDRLTPYQRQQVDNETRIHSSLCHRQVAQLIVAFEDSRVMYTAVEFAEGGDLRRHMTSSGIGEQRVRDFIVQPLLQALVLLQHENVVHRDIKPDNVLVHEGEVRLADFGLAVYSAAASSDSDNNSDNGADSMNNCHADGSHHSHDSTSALPCSAGGTPLYAAPEVLLAMFNNQPAQEAICHKNDMWALGVIALEAVTGKHPFAPKTSPDGHGGHHNQDNLLYNIAHHTKVHLPPHLTPELTDILTQLLQRDPEQRPAASDLLGHPWFQRSYSGCSSGSGGAATSEKGSAAAAAGGGCGRGLCAASRVALDVQVECWEY